MVASRSVLLYRLHEPTFRTQYIEVKERSLAAGALLPGTPGQLVRHEAAGRSYWYRRHYPVQGGKQMDAFVGRADDEAAYAHAMGEIEFAEWVVRQVRTLRKLQFQVADKDAARVLVELHNTELFSAGLVVVGTLAFMAWLNELGAHAVASRTQDIDLARRQPLKLAAPQSFLQTVQATSLKFSPIPALSLKTPATSVKLPGAAGLRVDLLADGPEIGQVIEVPELAWHAQTIPHFSYLLHEPRPAALLAGGHCVPVNLPSPERFVWHKVYSASARVAFKDKAPKDLLQAATLAAVLVEHDDAQQDLAAALAQAPAEVRAAAQAGLPALRAQLALHPQAQDAVEQAVRAV